MSEGHVHPYERLTVAELFVAACLGGYQNFGDESEIDSVDQLQAVHELSHRENQKDVFDAASFYLRSALPIERTRALDVLGQLGRESQEERPYHEQSVTLATPHLHDVNEVVVFSAAWALANLGGLRAQTILIEQRHHSDAGVRRAVAFGMTPEHPQAIATLIELMGDEDDEVREWATAELGSFPAVDSVEVVDALRERLSDSHDDARAEAIWALARRKDPQGLRILLDRLLSDEGGYEDQETAAEIVGLSVNEGATDEDLCNGLRELIKQSAQ